MPFEVNIRTTKDTEKLLKDMPKMIRKGLVAGMSEAMTFAAEESKKSFGKSGKPGNISFTLRDSIKPRSEIKGDRLTGVIGSDVIYARIHELGGKAGRGRLVTIPRREYLKPAIQDNLRKITDMLTNSVWEEFQR